ncbi:MAG: amidohydrolase/deacetylase family metallohydrolase [Bacillota bacterium]|uniref:Amidohydrolase/deacetylase family metallohydrolase n=1 Tax=Virgibacillus salarius TaxID=447199 RepID=A0A941DRH8_9BACI|nr:MULTISPECIES: amidohydrolase/deacetylase family metallohydrolase [Bacillaceae]NAZ08427.1 amidohydrolase/deacetylase family metallohydrolase [Agaribacter marinus]MBR7795714.1 amidohydrolase/deacetylase family metallohydrolase [Virgibacillus salarius]MCC2248580.1 amidohydrolase/deacetylase family metallohydrolase [Virgibacillus sp. AGTR]MDY7043218.1 amidohydrolase/deacetylase family metallohydrolase [Virgibacillus sp. M23]QRZ18339.1 amidohydrolase/deacetylase family metallohydrolase [Virgibac
MCNTYVLHNVSRLNHQKYDFFIEDGTIKAISEPKTLNGEHVIDCTGLYVSSGWIDLHVHAFPEFDPYGDDVDEIGIKQGVTTVVDAGSCGADRIADLHELSKQCKTNLLAFLNISSIGLKRIDELSNLSWINSDKVVKAVEQFPDFIVGLKARMSKSVVGEQGIKPLQLARRLSLITKRSLMVHIGSSPPYIEQIFDLLEKEDIVTHFLHGKANRLFDNNEHIHSFVTKAVNKGIHLDVGHGSASFSFQVAEAAKRQGLKFDTISTDIYRNNRLNGPVYSMSKTLSKFLYLGYSIEEVIAGVTINAANWLKMPKLGRIQEGEPANLTLFSIENSPVKLIDSEGEEQIATKHIKAKGVFKNGTYLTC